MGIKEITNKDQINYVLDYEDIRREIRLFLIANQEYGNPRDVTEKKVTDELLCIILRKSDVIEKDRYDYLHGNKWYLYPKRDNGIEEYAEKEDEKNEVEEEGDDDNPEPTEPPEPKAPPVRLGDDGTSDDFDEY